MTQKCPNCGIKIISHEQKVCEKCGFKLPRNKNIKRQIIAYTQRKLFELNQGYYILKKEYWEVGSGYIFDAQDQIIGIVNARKKRRIELKEVDGSVAAVIQFKSKSMRGASELKDNEGNIMAKLKKKKISDFHSIYFLEDPKGTRWYKADGEFINFKFKIEDLSRNKIVAEVNKTEKWKDILNIGKLDHKNDYALKILDNETDRRILLLFIIGIRQIRYFRMF